MVETASRALLLTDVVDSTRMVEELGDERAAAVWAAHDRAARELLAAAGGLEIDKTDGFLLLFEDVSSAVTWGIAWHAALRRLSVELGVPLTARAGLHYGDVVLRRNPPEDVARGAKPLEVEGLAKPVAARVMSVASGGQTLLTAAAGARLDAGHELRSHGWWRMKGVDAPVELFEVGDERSRFLPPPDGAKVYRVVRDGDGWRPARDVPNNLPVRGDAFLGRVAELRELGTRLEGPGTLVTLLGPGGTGKTRLSLEFARATLGDWPGGAWFVELEDVRAGDALLAALANALGVQLTGADPLAWLAGVVADRPPTLLVLDNLEQLVQQGAPVIERFRSLAHNVGWLVSSREPLRVAGEQVMRLEALSAPAADAPFAEIAASDAVRLFVERAKAVGRFELSEDNSADVVELVRLLDGMPLAIELAAARAPMMGPRKLVARMSQRFKLLARGRRGARARQATLRGAIDWSWDLLEPAERLALAQCSVFRGGFTLEAAEAVLDLDVFDDAPWPMDVVQTLMDKSLLRTWTPDGGGDDRATLSDPLFGMYVSIQEYASEKLRDPAAVVGPDGPVTGRSAERALSERHARHYAGDDPIARIDEAEGAAERLAGLALERENLRVALEFALEAGELDVAAACWLPLAVVARMRGPAAAAADPFARLDVGRVSDPDLRDRVWTESLNLFARLGRFDEERASATSLAELRSSRGDRTGALEARVSVVRAGLFQDRERARPLLRQLYEEAEELGAEELMLRLKHDLAVTAPDGPELAQGLRELAESGETRVAISATYNLGVCGLGEGRFEDVHASCDRVLAWALERGSRMFEMLAYNTRGQALAMAGDWDAARPMLERTVRLAEEIEERRWQYGGPSIVLALAQVQAGELVAARRRLERALPLSRALGDRYETAWVLAGLARLCVAEGALDGAKRHLDEAEALAPGRAEAQLHIAWWVRQAWAAYEEAAA